MYEGSAFFVAIVFNCITACLALWCIIFEFRTAKNKWYIGANTMSLFIQVFSITQVILGILIETVPGYVTDLIALIQGWVPFYYANLFLAPFLLILLIKQNTDVLRNFSFFNERACRRLITYVLRFLAVDAVVTGIICGVLVGLHTSGGNPGLYMTYTVNTVFLGVVLFLQTAAQNYWIVTRVHEVSKTLYNVEGSKEVFIQLWTILGALTAVDM